MSWKDYINPYTVAGGLGGMYAGHVKYGKKHGYKAVAGGAFAGVLAGILVEKLVAPKGPTPAQIAAAQQQQQQQQQQVQQPAPGQGEYINLDGTDPMDAFAQTPPPPPPNANPQQRAEYEAQQAAHDNLGSLSGSDGLGSLSGTPGFDADTIDYDEILGESDGSNGYN
jgi:hypothetical protein